MDESMLGADYKNLATKKTVVNIKPITNYLSFDMIFLTWVAYKVHHWKFAIELNIKLFTP